MGRRPGDSLFSSTLLHLNSDSFYWLVWLASEAI